MFEPIHGSAFDITGMGIGKSLRFVNHLKSHENV
jgi:isocitrate/isopropylmalate dehydrogenase